DERSLDPRGAAGRDQVKRGAVQLQVDVGGAEITILDSIQYDLFAASRFGLRQALSVFIVGVDHGGPRGPRSAAEKQDALGLKVAVHVFVVIQVIAREVGEDRRFVGHTPYALLRQSVRGNFHHRVR